MAASKYGVLEGEVRDLLENGLGKFLTDLTDGSGDHQPSIILGQQLSKAFQSYYDLKAKLEKDTLDCAVLALTKSGKSTLLNAFCGASILPSNNVPETARIVALEHCNLGHQGRPSLKYKVNGEVVEVEGEEHIRCHLEILNKQVRGRKHSKDDEQILTVRTQLAALQAQPQDLKVGLRLLDTPGPNEAGEDALRHSVERLLDSVDAVVYILDYTKLKTTEEADLLSKLAKSNPQLVMRLAQRLFFVVNKMDVMHTSEGLEEDELRDYVAELVTKQMNFASFQLRPEQILLVSAEDALLSRLVLSGKDTQKQRERFARKQFGRAAKAKHSAAEYEEGAKSLLEESHLLDLEKSLLGYLYDHAGSLKIVSLLDGIAKLLTQMKNVAVTAEAAMKVSSDTLTAEVENLKTSLASTSQEFKAVQKQASDVENDVINNVQNRMLLLKEKLVLHIEQVLDPEAPPPAFNPEEAQHRAPWQQIWAKSAAFFTRSKAQESSSDAALKAKLSDLHSDIKRQIESEITEFWHELETATNQTYQELIAVINQHLLELARKIEGSVGKVLDLCLKPLDICLQRPSAEEFHSSIQDLLRHGIKHGKRREVKYRDEDHVEWQKRYRGICNHSEYYVGIPVKRRVSYHEEVPVFSLDPDSIKEHFNTMVESSISISIKNVKDYVHVFMSDQIEAAHAKISSYSALYADAMSAALTAKTLSAFEQNANVAALKANIAAVEHLLSRASNIAQTANNLFPQLDVDSYDWITDSERDFPMEGPSSLGFEMRSGAASPLDPLSVPVTRALPQPGSSISNPAAVPAVTSAPLHAGANSNADQMPSISHEERSHAPELGDPMKDTRDWKALSADTVRIPVITPAGFELDTTESDAESETDSETETESEGTTESEICKDPGMEEYSGSESESTSTDSYEESTEEESTEEEEEEDAVDPFYDDEEEEGDSEDDHSTGLVLDADYVTERDAVDRLTESLNQSLLGVQERSTNESNSASADPFMSIDESSDVFEDPELPLFRFGNFMVPDEVEQSVAPATLPISDLPVQEAIAEENVALIDHHPETWTGTDDGQHHPSPVPSSEHDSFDWECVSETDAEPNPQFH